MSERERTHILTRGHGCRSVVARADPCNPFPDPLCWHRCQWTVPKGPGRLNPCARPFAALSAMCCKSEVERMRATTAIVAYRVINEVSE